MKMCSGKLWARIILVLIAINVTYLLVKITWSPSESALSPQTLTEVHKTTLVDGHPVVSNGLSSRPIPDQSKHFIVYTRYRSGSSFFGQLLNQHPNIYYMFEPLKLFKQNNTVLVYLNRTAGMYLRQVLDCNFRQLVKDAKATGMRPNWIQHVFCEKVEKKDCLKMQLKDFAQLCSRYQYTASKIISLRHLSSLDELMRTNYKVIQLVRDPRGVMSSRMKIDQKRRGIENVVTFLNNTKMMKALETDAQRYCNDVVEDMEYRYRMTSADFIQVNYKLVRYEDFAKDPVERTQDLYQFLGIDLDQSILDWIQSSTTVDISRQTFKNNAYRTERDSRKTAEAWRKHLPFFVVDRLQRICADALYLMKYRLVDSEVELLDMRSSLVHDWDSSEL